ncbi:hypothetical protein [Puerhibacterium sp. TATVAM-FAB25]|uniref:hypothetical protein n=1 Tax=Puerhibacterium sp. TATVAM-FAB25 TaxID=3093699 RepID=UPI00397B4445
MPHTDQPGRPDGTGRSAGRGTDRGTDRGAGRGAGHGAGRGDADGGDHGGAEPGGPDRPTPPGALRALLVAVVLEALVLTVAAVVVAVEAIGGGSDSVAMSVFLVVFALGMAWALLAAGRVLRAGRHGGRSVIMTWQIFQAVVAASMLASGATAAVLGGVGLLALAVAVAVLLLTPSVVRATTD